MAWATEALPADWMTQTAGQLGDALGWPIAWNAAAGKVMANTASVGTIEVHDGTQTVGRLLVEPPDSPRLQSAFGAACDVTQVLAGVLSRLAVAECKLQSQYRSVATLNHVTLAPQSEDLKTKLAGLLKAAVHSAGLWSAAFFLTEAATSRLRLRATHNLPARCVPAGCAEQLSIRLFDRFRSDEAAYLPDGFAIGMMVPVLWQSQVIGSLWCFDRRNRSLSDWEVQVLQSIAAQIAVVLERVVLMEESAQRRQLKSELRFASRTLPIGQSPPLPDECRLDVSIRSASVIEVGGDLCEVIPCGDHRTLIAIGDAVGHGIPAAMLASVTRGALQALLARSAPEELTTPALMIHINRALHAITRSEQFVTLVLAMLDPQTGNLTYTNAGHPPPLLLRDGEWQSLKSHGLFLGVSADTAYESTELHLHGSDVLVCFTDGVTETVNRSRQVFRRQGIRDTIPTANGATADAIAETIWQRLQSHDPDRPLRDDRTLLVMKFLDHHPVDRLDSESTASR